MTARGRGRVVRREGEQVTPLELFFDLVMVLAITQCSTLMESEPPWRGLARGVLALAVLWWTWVGYAWLTSVVDPEEGTVRLAMFAAMAALLVMTLCIPQAFGDLALAFALGYAVVSGAHIWLFTLASRDDPELRRSVLSLAAGMFTSVALLVASSFVDAPLRPILWVLAIAISVGGPFFFGERGWKLVPGHFAERHGLIVIIALGESIVAIGVGASDGVTAAVVTTAVLGVLLAATLWWAYFDVVSIATARRLASLPPGPEQNAMARDAYSYLHFPMVAGIVLASFGLKEVILHPGEALHTTAALGLCGGLGLYLFGHVAFRWRIAGTINRERLGVGVLLVALTGAAVALPGWASLVVVLAVMVGIVGYETVAWAETRDRVRHHPELAIHPDPDPPPGPVAGDGEVT